MTSQRKCFFVSAVLAMLTAMSWWVGAAAAQPKLPGARVEAEAINYPSLQAALDKLPPEGGKVVLPAGEFEIDTPLVVNQEDVWIEGAGTATHIVNTNTDGKPALLIQPKDFAENPRSRIWRVGIARLRITGNPASGHGIEANGVNEILIDGISVTENGGDGIRLTDCYEDPRICSALLTYNKGAGLYLLRCHDIVVSANQFEENQDALRCIDSFNLCMTGNNIDDHLGDGVVIENTYGSVVSGNMIEECQGTAIVLDRDCYGIALSANVIAHNMTGGIDLRDAHGCTVSANAFTIDPKIGLRIRKDSGRIAVTGNSFSDSYLGDGQVKRAEGDRAAGGILIEGATDITVSGNSFSGVAPQALSVEGNGARRLTVTGNTFTNTLSGLSAVPESIIEHNMVDSDK